MTKPRSWKEVLAHPDIESIDDHRKEFPEDSQSEMWIYVWLKPHVENPVTNEMGGGFYAGDMKDVISHFSWNSVRVAKQFA